jgi:hypothetical protein
MIKGAVMNFLKVLFALLIIFVPSVLFSAELIISPGDNLTKLGERTGHSIAELAAMNGIKNPNLIYTGKKLTYVSEDDRVNAVSWCIIKKNLSKNLSDIDKEYYSKSAINVAFKKIDYFGTGKGVRYRLILHWSKEYKVFEKAMSEFENFTPKYPDGYYRLEIKLSSLDTSFVLESDHSINWNE